MRETLFIRLTASLDGPVAIRIDGPAGIGSVQEVATGDALQMARGRRVVAIVPGADVRLTAATVPIRQPSKALLAVPFALEDTLAEDVEALHFALGPRQADGRYPVAVVSRARMAQWLQPLIDAGVPPEAMYPDLLCLPPPEPGSWTLLVEPERYTVRTELFRGFTCRPQDFATLLQLADPNAQVRLRALVSGGFESDLTTIQRPVGVLPGFSSGLAALLSEFDPARAISLLQGAYSQQRDLQRLWMPWRLPAALAAGWVVAALVTAGLEAARLDRELEAQRQANVERFQALFPGQTRIVDLEAQVEQQLALSGGGGQRQSLVPLLESLAGGLAARPGLGLESVQYREGALFASLTGKDLQALEDLRAWYAQQRGVVLDVQSANAGAEGVQIRLKLSLV